MAATIASRCEVVNTTLSSAGPEASIGVDVGYQHNVDHRLSLEPPGEEADAFDLARSVADTA